MFWGALHGLYQIAGELLEPAASGICRSLHVNTGTFSWKVLRILKTFFLVDIAWIFFRADTMAAAFQILRQSFDLSNTGLLLNNGLYELGLNERNISILLLAFLLLAAYSILRECKINVMEQLSRQNALFRYAVYWTIVVLITFSLDITGQEFIYFQF